MTMPHRPGMSASCLLPGAMAMSHVLVPMILTSVPGAMPHRPRPDARRTRRPPPEFPRASRCVSPIRRSVRPPRGRSFGLADEGASATAPSFGCKLAQKFGIGITAPLVIVHRLVAGGANADGEFVRRFGAGQHRGNAIGHFHPRMRGVENFRGCVAGNAEFC